MNKSEAEREQLLMQVVREADLAAAQIPDCRICGKPSPNGDPCESCNVKSMNKSEIAEKAAREILAKFGRVHPRWLVTCTKIVERAIAESRHSNGKLIDFLRIVASDGANRVYLERVSRELISELEKENDRKAGD